MFIIVDYHTYLILISVLIFGFVFYSMYYYDFYIDFWISMYLNLVFSYLIMIHILFWFWVWFLDSDYLIIFWACVILRLILRIRFIWLLCYVLNITYICDYDLWWYIFIILYFDYEFDISFRILIHLIFTHIDVVSLDHRGRQ